MGRLLDFSTEVVDPICDYSFDAGVAHCDLCTALSTGPDNQLGAGLRNTGRVLQK